MTVHEIIILARKYVMQGEAPMQSSAALCLKQAIEMYDEGFFDSAKNRAVKSLAYTVGIHHPDYVRASR